MQINITKKIYRNEKGIIISWVVFEDQVAVSSWHNWYADTSP